RLLRGRSRSRAVAGSIPEGAERSRCDHFRLAERLRDVAQYSSREEIASGVSCLGPPHELTNDTGPCQGEGMRSECKLRWCQVKVSNERRARHDPRTIIGSP